MEAGKALLGVTIALGLAVPAGAEVWESSAGKEFRAEFISLRDGMARLKLPDGRFFEAELSKFSEASQDRLRAEGQSIPALEPSTWTLNLSYPLERATFRAPGGGEILAELAKEGYDAIFFGPRPHVKIYLKQEGRRIGDPFTVEYGAASSEKALGISRSAHTLSGTSAITQQLELEDGSRVDVIVALEENQLRLGLRTPQVETLKSQAFAIAVPVVATVHNDGDKFFSLAHTVPAPQAELDRYLEAHPLAIRREKEEGTLSLTLADAVAEVTFPERFSRLAVGGAGFGQHMVVFDAEWDSHLGGFGLSGETVDPVLWGGFGFRFEQSSLHAEPRKETLLIRILAPPSN